jgi:hypothetical protein
MILVRRRLIQGTNSIRSGAIIQIEHGDQTGLNRERQHWSRARTVGREGLRDLQRIHERSGNSKCGLERGWAIRGKEHLEVAT